MTIGLGIDTGGTYTDAVLIDLDIQHVLSCAKALTTRHDLSLGIKEALESVMKAKNASTPNLRIDMVGLSTTLATNAIAEGNGGRVCLLLIGYDRELIRRHGFEGAFATDSIEYIQGGHDLQGDEAAPLDEESIRTAVLKYSKRVESIAISSYFGTRNPEHEIRARTIVEALTDLPVTCGHDLTSRLNSIRRATTVSLNASLIPLLRTLIISVRDTLNRLGIVAPLLVVKGDGSLMRAEWAIKRPVETILSGPAASLVGARTLSRENDVWVADMGGTTTDIARLNRGQLLLKSEGATVGNRRTMVEAADVYTVGLGGDSQVSLDHEKEIHIGPRRVTPLCLLAEQHPEVLGTLRHQVDIHQGHPGAGQFATFWRNPSYELPYEDRTLLERIQKEPIPLVFRGQEEHWMASRIESFEKMCLVQRAGFTPTDALHALKHFAVWNPEASLLGAALLAHKLNQSIESFCRSVIQRVSEGIVTAIISKIISDWVGPPDWTRERTAKTFLDHSLNSSSTDELKCELTLQRPLVALGAPAAAYMPRAAEILHAQLIIPPYSEVANAIGAVVGSVIYRRKMMVTPLEGGCKFRAHLPEGIKDFSDLEEAVAYAQKNISALLEAFAHRCGAGKVTIQMERSDHVVQDIYLDTELLFTATGRPAIGV